MTVSVVRMAALRALVLVVLLAVSLAGCSGSGKGGADSASSTGPGQVGTGNSTVRAVITVAVGANLTAPVNGTITVLLGVAATFNASRSTGAILTYNWTFGDNGTAKERVAKHTYAAPGLFNVTLKVATSNLTANATLRVRVVGEVPGKPLFHVHEEFAGSLPLGNPNSPTTAGTDYMDHTVAVVGADANGTKALAKIANITVHASGVPANQIFVYWIDPAGNDLATAGDIGDTSSDHALSYEGGMPAGDYVLRVRLFFGASADYTATVDLDYVTA